MESDNRSEHGDELSDSQTAALIKAWDILKEHFDSLLLCYDTEVQEGTARAFATYYHGGITTCVGLAERAKYKMVRLPEDAL